MSDGTEVLDSVVDAAPGDAAPSARGGGVLKTFVLALVLFGAGVAFTTIRLPYLVLEPGSTFETEEFIAVDGTELYPNPEAEVRFVTVTQRRVTAFGWLVSKLQDSDRIFHEDELLRGRTFDEQREENAQLMLSSQNNAIAAALIELGVVVAEPAGAVVVDVVEGGALDGLVARNHVISGVDGTPISTVDELYDRIEAAPIGTEIELVVAEPGDEPREITVGLTEDTAGFVGIVRSFDVEEGSRDGALIDDVIEGGPVDGLLESGDLITNLDGEEIETFDQLVELLGGMRSGDEVGVEAVRPTESGDELITGTIVLGSRVLERAGLQNAATQFRDAELPFDIEIVTEEIGGPSAGLAFTLTILDVLTEGDLVGGGDVVVTGTMSRDGTVGAIGGVHQKAFAARDAGAKVFIVPRANLEEARAAVDDLRIEPVDTLDDALAVLAELGGNAGELPQDGRL